jgi:hypothetical protein
VQQQCGSQLPLPLREGLRIAAASLAFLQHIFLLCLLWKGAFCLCVERGFFGMQIRIIAV